MYHSVSIIAVETWNMLSVYNTTTTNNNNVLLVVVVV